MTKILLLCLFSYFNLAFMFVMPRTTTTSRALHMGGGRNKEEVSLSKREMFQKIKTKLNTEAQTPGFFDVGEKVDMELYCKGNKDGTQIGDCPFTQFVQMVMLKKGLKYDVKPTLSSNKPAWINEAHGGKLPLLLHKDLAITESLAIAEYIEKMFPHSSLTRQGAYSYQEVLEKTSAFFPTLKALIINKDTSKDADLMTALNTQLDTLDEILRSTPGQFLCGIELTLADLYMLPLLFHAFVAVNHFKDVEIYHVDGEPMRPALENYLDRMFNMEEFNSKKAYVSADTIIYGWKVARGDL